MAPDAADTGVGRTPETVDRVLVGVCGAIWLVLLAASVIATVALVRLGTGQAGAGEKQSSWLLYSIIVVSALVIAGAIPLLIRARRDAQAEPAAAELPAPPPESPARAADAPTEKMRVFGTAVDPHQPEPAPADAVSRIDAVLERIWLRGTTILLGAMGLALTAVAIATYLLAVRSDLGAWVALGVAGAITAAMVAVLVVFQRRVAQAADEAANDALA